MKRPYENVLKCDAETPQSCCVSPQKELGLALLLGQGDTLKMLERMAPLLGERAQYVAALARLAEAEKRPTHAPAPITELQRMEKQLEAIKKFNNEANLDGIIRAVRLGDEVSRKGPAALIPMFMGNENPMMSAFINMMMSGGNMGDVMGGAKDGGIMNYLLNLMGKGGAAL